MKKLALIFISSLLITSFYPISAFAESYEVINSFSSSIVGQTDGSLNVTEDINYDFGDNSRHGIFRNIPTTTSVGNLYRISKITVYSVTRDGASEDYSLSDNGSQLSIKIGNANQTITGVHDYTISYNISNSVSTFSDHDEIYWNVTGNDWQVQISSASATISTTANTTPLASVCYSGSFGSRAQDCQSQVASGKVQFVANRPLNPGEGLSAVVSYPLRTFPTNILSNSKPSSFDLNSLNINTPMILGYLGLVNILLPVLALIWYFTSKHSSRFGKVGVNFDIPKDSKGNIVYPAEAGALDSAKVTRDDIVATLFDLAIRKFIKLENETKTSSFLGIHSKDQKFYVSKLKDYGSVAEFEKILLDRIFQDGDRVDISSLSSDFYLTFSDFQAQVIDGLIAKGLLKYNPSGERTGMGALAVLSLVTGGVILAIVLVIISSKLYGRTDTGDELEWRIQGLKLFLKNMSREYKWQAEQLYIVEKMIPYAMALGYINQYMEQLKIIKPNYHPYWYSGNAPFYAMYPVMFSSFNSSFAIAAPSSSSGFGGGGFSGGGGGGGGGGSW